MTTSFSVLQDLVHDRLNDIDKATEEFLQPVLAGEQPLHCAEAKGYGNFTVQFLHTCVSKLKKETDKTNTRKLLIAAEHCCSCYVKVWDKLTLDDDYTVPKLVYHILNSVKHKDYAVNILNISRHILTFLTRMFPLPPAGEKITQSFFAFIWNLPHRLGSEKANKLPIETTLQLQHCSLMFLCLLTDMDMLTERLQFVMSEVVSLNKDPKSTNCVKYCSELSVQIFSDVLDHLKTKKSNSQDITFLSLKVFFMFVEHLIRIGNHGKAETVLADFVSSDIFSDVSANVRQILGVGAQVYELALQMKTLAAREDNSKSVYEEKSPKKSKRDNSKTSKLKDSKSKNVNGVVENVIKDGFDKLTYIKDDTLTELLGCLTLSEASLLHSCFHFVSGLLGTKTSELAHYPPKMIETLITCVHFGIEISKIMLRITKHDLGNVKTSNKDGVKKKPANTTGTAKAEDVPKIYQTLLMAYFKQLLLIYQQIQDSEDPTSSSMCASVCTVATELEASLDLAKNILTSKVLYTHRYNCSYICREVAKICVRQDNYKHATILNTIVLKQIRICGHQEVAKFVESLLDCHLSTGQREKAVEVILESSLLEGNITSCVALWVKLKREAIAKQQTDFLQRTLSSVIGRIPGHKMSTQELLILENNAWKKISSRNHAVEYHILSELVAELKNGIEKYSYMVELAKNMCITGNLFQERSADAILSEVLDDLDESSPQSQAVLALANFTKYVVKHENIIQELNSKQENEGKLAEIKIDAAGDTNQSTPNRHRAAANQRTPDRFSHEEPTNQGSCFTLATEKPYLKYLQKALELWEKCMGEGVEVNDIDMHSHLEALVACGTRLTAMKQPRLALRALQVAQCQMKNLNDGNMISRLEEKLAKVLMLLGMYEEAEQLINSEKGNQKSAIRSLLMAELQLLMGKKQEGMDILNEVLGQEAGARLTKSVYLAKGYAKRLLSMFLCFPGDHLVQANNQYLLTLAIDAVVSHFGVLQLIVTAKSAEASKGSVEKWTCVLEVLQSLLHLCQLYRLIGLPRNALCYLREGLKLSQAQGLPRWGCEFLFEMLRVQSMEANSKNAIDTIDTINQMLRVNGTTHQFTPCFVNKTLETSTSKLNCEVSDQRESEETNTDPSPECFGFNGLASTPKAPLQKTDVTPGKDSSTGELDSCRKKRLAELTIPQCQCLNGENTCSDAALHRLCYEAGIVIVEFLTVSELKTKAYSILDKLLAENKELVGLNHLLSLSSLSASSKKDSGHDLEHFEPSLKYLCLEAKCIQAEAFGQQKLYKKVHQIWHEIKQLEQSGFFDDVLHSNILVARLALCEATSFLHSLQSNFRELEFDISTSANVSLEMEPESESSKLPESEDTKMEGGSETDVTEIQNKLEDLTLDKRTVTFGDKAEVFIVEDDKEKGSKTKARNSRKKKSNEKENSERAGDQDSIIQGTDLSTPLKSKSSSVKKNTINTPKSQIFFHTPGTAKARLNFQTPLSVNNRQMTLDFLLEDSDDDIPVFPELKPVTPKVDQSALKKSAKSTKSKTESKKSKKKLVDDSSVNVICNLNLALSQSSSPSDTFGEPKVSLCELDSDRTRLDKTKLSKISSTSHASESSNIPSNKTDSNATNTSQTDLVNTDLQDISDKLEIVGVAAKKNDKSKTISVRGKRAKMSKSKAKCEDVATNKISHEIDSCKLEEKKHHSENSTDLVCPEKVNSSKPAVKLKSNYKETCDNPEHNKAEEIKQKNDVYDFDDDASPEFTQSKVRKGRTSVKTKTNSKSKTSSDKITKASRMKESISEKDVVTKYKSSSIDGDNNDKLKLKTIVETEHDNAGKAAAVQKNAKVKDDDELVVKRGRKCSANPKATSASTKTRATRGKKAVEDIEKSRNRVDDSVQELHVSLDGIEIYESDEEEIPIRHESWPTKHEKSPEVSHSRLFNAATTPQASASLYGILDNFTQLVVQTKSPDYSISPELEPIEVMRGDKRTSKSKGKGKKERETSRVSSPDSMTSSELEPIEIMRGDRKTSKSKGKGRNDRETSPVFPPDSMTSSELEPIELMRGDRKTSKSKGKERKGRETSPVFPPDSMTSSELEPIELMRGDRKTTKSKGKGRKKAEPSTHESESTKEQTDTGVEVMRSSRRPSLKDLSDRMACSPDASVMSSSSSGASSPDQQDIIAALENVYYQIRRLAPYPRHSDICQILALHYLQTNPQRAAFLLSDSIAVTFRHQAMLNMGKKVKKLKSGDSVEVNQGSLEGYVDGLFFNKDQSNLQEMIDIIPPDWSVLQVSVINQLSTCPQIILTRFARNQSPLVLHLPGLSSPQGREILKNFTSIIKRNMDVMKITVKVDWWKIRRELDSDMETLVEHMEKFWAGPWRGVFKPRQFSEQTLTNLLDELKKRTKREIDLCHAEILLQSAESLSDRELHRCASELLGSNCSSSDIETIISQVKETAKSAEKMLPGHVVLILDKAIQHLPWECIPALKNHSVSRMPCLSHLYTQLNYLQSQESSVFVRGVNPERTYYMVNPDDNLPNSESVFKDWFQGEKGWKGIVGKPPTKEQFTEAITDHDLLIYCGHGSGGRYFNSDDLEKLQGRAAIILMGCSSGKLSVKGQLEPSGMMISYFLAGCPCMVANLWDVTDRDIDKFLEHLLKTWLTSEDGTSLSRVVQESRQACKMKNLVGCAPVVYGLPVFIRRK